MQPTAIMISKTKYLSFSAYVPPVTADTIFVTGWDRNNSTMSGWYTNCFWLIPNKFELPLQHLSLWPWGRLFIAHCDTLPQGFFLFNKVSVEHPFRCPCNAPGWNSSRVICRKHIFVSPAPISRFGMEELNGHYATNATKCYLTSKHWFSMVELWGLFSMHQKRLEFCK